MTTTEQPADITEQQNRDGWRILRDFLTPQDMSTLEYLETWQGVSSDALTSLACHRAGQNIAEDR